MSEILFGQSYYLRFDPKLWDAMQPYPPLGTMIAASTLCKKGYDVALFDAMLAESEDEWAEALSNEQPRVAIIYEDNFNYLSKMCLLRMREAAFTMTEMAKARGCTVIVCGSDASDHPDEYLDRGVDYVLIGEGENTLGELMESLGGQGPELSNILGLVFKRDGRVMSNPRRPDIKDVDSLPLPAWDLVDVPRYREIWMRRHGYFSMNMVTTRGCPFHCNWCAKPIWGQRYNARSPENVVLEMKWLKDTYHPDHIWFVDDIMGLKPGWMARFAELVEQGDARIPFKSLNRADLLLKPGEVEALKKAGCQVTWIGAESGSQKILDAMEKGTKVEQIYAAARRLHEAGLKVGFFLQFGYPGESLEDIEKTLQMVRDCQPDDIGMSVSYPLPGTTFYNAVKEQMGAKQNWTDSSDLAMMYNGPFNTEFYRQLHTTLHREYRARKTWRQVTNGDALNARKWLSLANNAARLPIERRRLMRLARQPRMGIQLQPPTADPQAAAEPTPQE